jgi:hypothetical protein
MTQITVQFTGSQVPLPADVPFAALAFSGTDNSGAPISGTLNGTETPPWSAVLTGATGPGEVTVTAQALDTAGNNLGTPFTLTESGTGGQPGTFFQASGGTISVS